MADRFNWAVRLREEHSVPKVLQECIAFEGPAFLEVIIDPEACVYPMVGPGLSYKEMLSGEHIRPREGPQRPRACGARCRTKVVGESDAGNPHIRFDEGAQETCDSVTRLRPTLPPALFSAGSAVISRTSGSDR